MLVLILRVIEKLLIIYFGVYLLVDLLMYAYASGVFLFGRKRRKNDFSYEDQRVSIIVPAYNEEVSIEACLHTMQGLDYPDYEIIVVNDGSTDGTMDRLMSLYDWEPYRLAPGELPVRPVRAAWKMPGRPVILIDKANGGKADAINAGINAATGKYICTVDADSVLDRDALRHAVRPFLEREGTIVSGGQLAVLNGVEIRDNRIVNARVPRNLWVQWQIIEYIKSFLISRMAFSRINALLIMSGAFSVFRRRDLLEAGGFMSAVNNHPALVRYVGEGKQTVCEDMEIVVRLWRHARDRKRKAHAAFVPEAVCWTEVPDNPRFLFKQRARWHQGLGETLKWHRAMIFDPRYGATGLIGMPYYLFFEFLSPVVKVLTLVFLVVASVQGLVNTGWLLLLLAGIILLTAFVMASVTVIIEHWSRKAQNAGREALRYKTFGDWLQLIGAGILSEFTYAFFRIAAQLNGIYRFLRKRHEWNKFARRGVHIQKEKVKTESG